MNARLPLLAAALVSLLLSSPASAATAELFHETFDNNDQSWSDGTHNKDSFGSADNAGWSLSFGTLYPGLKGVRLGSSSVLGGAITPSFALSNRTEAVTITVVAAAHPSAGSSTQTLHVDVLDSSSSTNKTFSATLTKLSNDVEIPETANYVKTFTLLASELPATGNISLSLYGTSSATGQRRVLVGDVLVTQNFDTGLDQLDMPENLVAPSTNFYGFALSWDAVPGANNGYEVTLSPAVGNITVSGTTAIVTNLAESTTYTASVVAKGDGTTNDDSDPATLSVTTLTAPAVTAPALTPSAVSPSSFTVSWPAQPAADHFSVRAWTLVPTDVATENFADFPTVSGWTFNTDLDTYNDNNVKIKLDASGESVVSPTYPAAVSSLKFKVCGYSANGSSLSVSGSSNGSTWSELTNIVFTTSTKVNEIALSNMDNLGMTSFKWEFTKAGGGAGFGSVSVRGTGVGKARSYLEGYGSDAAGVAVSGTSVTISNPVAGETNYVEVTATGFTGRTASSEFGVPVPAHPAVISIQ